MLVLFTGTGTRVSWAIRLCDVRDKIFGRLVVRSVSELSSTSKVQIDPIMVGSCRVATATPDRNLIALFESEFTTEIIVN